MDWGTAKPYAVGWFCVVEGDTLLKAKGDYLDVWLPDKAVVMYRESYGWSGKPDTGTREESTEVAAKILKVDDECDETCDYFVGDNAMWAQVDGPSVAERMMSVRGRNGERLRLRPCSKDRAQQYQEFRHWIAGIDGRPMFYATENCIHFWRTVPSLMLDETRPEKGPDTSQEDHSYDMVIYGLMTRPPVTTERQRIEREFHKERRKAGLTQGGSHNYSHRQRKKNT